jgi:hypothetical protein
MRSRCCWVGRIKEREEQHWLELHHDLIRIQRTHQVHSPHNIITLILALPKEIDNIIPKSISW